MPSPAPSGDADVLVLRIPLRDTLPMTLTASQSTAEDPLQVANVDPKKRVGPAMISDCMARTWFQITNFVGNSVEHANTGNFDIDADGNDVQTASLKHAYLQGAELVQLMTVMYYLAPRDAAVPARLSLYRREGMDAAEEIAEGIERMEVRYGVDTTNDGRVDAYVDADAIPGAAAGTPNWNTVYSVQVSLLARAPEAYGTDIDAQQYTMLMAGNGVNAVMAGPFNDRFQRKVFTATAALRNQIID
jgi:type IV pilus assembly protein PilW